MNFLKAFLWTLATLAAVVLVVVLVAGAIF
jgi:hypothetical protein